MQATVDNKRFGPWAVITGASSGIGREFTRQIAASGIHVVLVGRREKSLAKVARECSEQFHVEHRIVAVDLSKDGFMTTIVDTTRGLDIGLVISNAGSSRSGLFLDKPREALTERLRLNSLAHLELAHHFGRTLTGRRSGGIIFIGAMSADKGVPAMANDAAAKAYVRSLALALHEEFKPSGVYVTLLAPGPTDTSGLAELGLDPKTMPMTPMKVDQCVYEGLSALARNKSIIIPGRLNRMMNAIVPAAVRRAMMTKLFSKASEKSREQASGHSE
jgi:short-subunit dehydrogenase